MKSIIAMPLAYCSLLLFPATLTAEVTVSGPAYETRPFLLSMDGPTAQETGALNPFRNYRVDVFFLPPGQPKEEVKIPAYFAADGNAANTSAEAGNLWRAHFVPPRAGTWRFRVEFRTGPDIAITGGTGEPLASDGAQGEVEVLPALLGDSWSRGKLQYAGDRYLRFSRSQTRFFKGGADSPENFLGYQEFDGTYKNPAAPAGKAKLPLHRYEPHVVDWRSDNSTWGDKRGKGILGALNYLAAKGMNSIYFITMNVHGDGDDVWPWIGPNERDRFDCSKLEQWNLVFDHMDRLGIMLHVVTQETENDCLLDGGELGPFRRLYYRELIARFAHHQAVVWNLGEETKLSTEQLATAAKWIKELDPYDNPIVVHTFPARKEAVLTPLLGKAEIDGASLQLDGPEWDSIPETVANWVTRSRDSGRPWVVSVDELGPAEYGIDPDDKSENNNQDRARRLALWSSLMAGGAGVEWYFGYRSPHHDLNCEDWRSRDRMWDFTRHALEFFARYAEDQLVPANHLLSGEPARCLASPVGDLFLVYIPEAGEVVLDLGAVHGPFSLSWFNPRAGLWSAASDLPHTPGRKIKLLTPRSQNLSAKLKPPHPALSPEYGGEGIRIGSKSEDDWVAVVTRCKSESSQESVPPEAPPILVEAELYCRQRDDLQRHWQRKILDKDQASGDSTLSGENLPSGDAYLHLLPDTRQAHADRLLEGENFSNEPGRLAILDYLVPFPSAGRYYVWVRALSTGSEDNSIHVGLDGHWPESGQRMQWCEGKGRWSWESRQRTAANHCGEPCKIFLDVDRPGWHSVSFSMREDGFRFDRFALTRSRFEKAPEW